MVKTKDSVRVRSGAVAAVGLVAVFAVPPGPATVAPMHVGSPAGSSVVAGVSQGGPGGGSAAQARSRAVKAAAALVAGRPASLHAGKDDVFVQLPAVSSQGWQYVPYERSYRGLPVVGGDFVVVVDPAGQVSSVSVAQTATISGVATTPGIGRAAAEKAASARLRSVSRVVGTRLVVDARGAKVSLAWESTLAGTGADGAGQLTVDVDAATGKVLDRRDDVAHANGAGGYNGSVSIATTSSNGRYWLADPNQKYLGCGDLATGSTFSKSVDTWGDGNDKTLETGCVDAMFAAQTETKMVSAWLGRNGLDGNGGAWPIRVSLTVSSNDTAYHNSDSPYVVIGPDCDCGAGYSQVAASLDVVGHENGHGIDAHTPGGMSGGNTAEFIADVFGTATEWYANESAPYDTPDWILGDSVYVSAAQRDMRYPSSGGFGSDLGPSLYCYSADTLTLDSHLAAGIGDRWFYMLANGTGAPDSPGYGLPCDNSTFGGVGLVNGLQILYSAMLMKTSASSYLNYRIWTLQAAKNLFPNDCSIFTKVRAAWNAVGVPPQPGEPSFCPMYANVITGDFSGDGKTDLALTGKDFESIPVAASGGDGTFGVTNSGQWDFAEWARGAGVHKITGDFNGDGKTDIALLPGPSMPWWYTIPVAMSKGDGSFTVSNANQWDFAGWVQNAGVQVVTGDFNGDGKTDIALLPGPNMPWWYTIPVAMSKGDGSFTVTNANQWDFAGWAQAPGVHALAGDFNHDGNTDIALVPGPNTPWWYTLPVAFSNRDGSFTVTNDAVEGFTSSIAQTPGGQVFSGDFNHDGRTDVGVTGGSGWAAIEEALSNGDGSFTVTSSARVAGLAGKCMDVYYGNTANGTRVQLFHCHGGTPQQWTVVGDGTIRALGKCLDVYGGGTASGTPVDLWDCNGGAAQQWQAVGGQLINPQSGKCLDVTGANPADWTPLQIWPCNGNAAQQWQLPTGISDFPGWASVSGVRLTTGDFNHDGNTDISLLPPPNTPWWYTTPIAFSNGDGTFRVTNAPASNFAGWEQAPYAQIISGDFNGDGKTDLALTGQYGWTTIPVAYSNGDGTFTIANTATAEDATFARLSAPTIIALPDLFEQDATAGAQMLQNVGLVAYRQPDITVWDSSEGGRIVWQSPAAGTLVSPGAVVQYSVGVFGGANR